MQVAMRLDRERFEPILCVSRWAPGLVRPDRVAAVEELRASGVRFLGLQRRNRAQLWAWRPLLSLLRREHVEILHSHKFGANVSAAVLASLARTPVFVAHEHTWSFEGRPLRRLLDRQLIARRADAFVAVSREDRRRMIEVEGISPAVVRLIPNGIPAPPAPGGRDVRVELGIPAGAPVVGTVCSLRAQKALGVLIGAAARLRAEFPELRVLVAGEGPERSRLERSIAERGLTGTVTLLGRRTDVPDLLTAFDVAACSSDYEGSPLSVMEYMEAALPVVATRVGGVPDLVDDRITGLLVEPGDPDALAAAIGELLRDRARARAMGERGRERRRSELDIDVTVRRIEALYEELYERAMR